MVVLTTGVVVAIVILAGFPTAGTATAIGVVVVVVVTELADADGGGAETICDSGSEAQPARRTRAPQHRTAGVSCLTAQIEAERIRILNFIFICQKCT
jgi:hypothetical protein